MEDPARALESAGIAAASERWSRLRAIGDPDLLLEEEGPCLEERHGRPCRGDGGDAVGKLVVQPAQEVDNEILIRERRANVARVSPIP